MKNTRGAQDMQTHDLSWDYKYKIRGSPWARRVVKIPLEKNTELKRNTIVNACK